MSNNKDEKKEEENFFKELFSLKEKEQNEQLYKNEFYVLEEEFKANKDQNSLQFMHNALLNKLMLEDYSPFPPKNEESNTTNPPKDEKKKDSEQHEKLIEEENEFLRGLHRINYLTFSPFGLSFFDDNNKDNQNLSEEYLKEKEEKILNMINFNYDSFEVTNDLLLNICQGFIDINKLRETNLKKENKNTTTTTVTKEDNISNSDNSPLIIGNFGNEAVSNPIMENKGEKEYDEILEEEINDIIDKVRDNAFYKPLIEKYENEKTNVDNRDKRSFLNKYKSLFKDKDDEYKEYQKKKKEEEEKRTEEEKRLRDLERKKELERKEREEKKAREQLELKKGLELIIQDARKRGVINNSSNKVKRRNVKNNSQPKTKKRLNHSMINDKKVSNASIIYKDEFKKNLNSKSKNKKNDKSLKKKKYK